MDRLAITPQAVCSIMDENGFTFNEIKEYLQNAKQPTDSRFYMDEIPTKKNKKLMNHDSCTNVNCEQSNVILISQEMKVYECRHCGVTYNDDGSIHN